MVRSQVNGESQTSRPTSAAWLAASSSRSGSPPVTRTALQCRSSPMTCSSRPTTSGSNGSRVLALEAERKKPVS